MIKYIKESFGELKTNVTWPTWANAQRMTVTVAVFSVLFSLAIWGVDTVFSTLVEKYFELMKK
ncbi:preprotein translocase subunit SecE [Pseudofulvibacter geojedonensis]|uniref:Protein translocase subunit SecE n=1 Tax=Pseudofulvibacter geojedonensis TaxID=1123758 RepID=A0ABW3I0P7_9FLAO